MMIFKCDNCGLGCLGGNYLNAKTKERMSVYDTPFSLVLKISVQGDDVHLCDDCLKKLSKDLMKDLE